MAIVKIGNCNHCGKCCLSMKLGGCMLENPCISFGEDRCKFYNENLNNKIYGHCLIYALGLDKIEQAKSREGKPITKEQIRWFNENCFDYPTIEDLGAGHKLPECSFTLEVVTDG